MRNLFITSLFLLTYLFSFAQEPLIINFDNFKVTTLNDTVIGVSAASVANIAAPQEGENMTWDYSKIDFSNFSVYVNQCQGASNPNFDEVNMKYDDFFDVIAANRGFYYDEYYRLNNNGFGAVGWDIKEQAYSIGDLTGGAKDSFNFPQQFQIYYRDLLSFPFSDYSYMSQNFSKTLHFNLTIAAYGINNTPGEKKSDFSYIDSVAGWGTLTVPAAKGDGTPSAAYRVLMVKRTFTRVDSLFLGGAPAPAPLLTAFGLVQGKVTTNNRYLFWRENSKLPMLDLRMDAQFEKVTNAFVDYHVDVATSVDDEIPASKIAVYLSPLNNSLYLNYSGSDVNISQVSVYDLLGNNVMTVNNFANQNSLKLPDNIQNGVYFFRAVSDEGLPVSNEKFVIQR